MPHTKHIVGVYPGTFDPVTNGHLDIIERSKKICSSLIVAIAHNPNKTSTLFDINERVYFLKSALKNTQQIKIVAFEGLLVDFMKKQEASLIIRGLRAVSDFDYEYAMFQMNSAMSHEVDTIFLLASQKYSFLSSSILKEFARYGRSVENYTPSIVSSELKKIYNIK